MCLECSKSSISSAKSICCKEFFRDVSDPAGSFWLPSEGISVGVGLSQVRGRKKVLPMLREHVGGVAGHRFPEFRGECPRVGYDTM